MMTRYAYDPVNYRLLRIRSESYTETDNEYTSDGNVQQDLGYLYDLAGNIIGIRDKAPATSGTSGAEGPGDLLKQFEYDPLNRLLSATGRESTAPAILPTWDAGVRAHDHTATNTYTRAYEFDKLGNVLQEQHTADGNASNNFTKVFNYHATQEHNKLLSFAVGGNTYTHAYDLNGNLITENTERHHQWGYDDKLKHFKIDAGGGASKWAHYLYDTAGTRVKKVVNKGGGIQEVTVCIDGVFEECYVKESGTIDPDKHWNTLHVLDGNSRLATVRVGIDADDATPKVKYNLEDHLGNSSVMVDAAGDLVNREEYYPFGDTSFGAFAKKRYRYNGKEKDNESGLYNYGMRYYAPWMCRFVSVDPLAASYAHLNPYNYAGNKPIGDVDIDGMQGTGESPSGGSGGANQALAPLARDANSNAVNKIEQKVQAIEASGGPKIPNSTAWSSCQIAIPPIEVKNPQDATASDVLRIPQTAPVLSGPSGPTAEEAAHLARHSYGDSDASDLMNGWSVAVTKMAEMTEAGVVFEDPATGLRSALYERAHEYAATEYVYATAGTNDLIDAKEDVNQAFGLDAPQYALSVKNARLLSDALKGSNLTFVGHSLGGGLASANAFATGRDAVTFNAAGLHPATAMANGLNMRASIDAYIINGEIVDHSQRLVGLFAAGNRHYMHALYAPDVPGTWVDDAVNLKGRIKNHLMDAVIDKMHQQGIKYR